MKTKHSNLETIHDRLQYLFRAARPCVTVLLAGCIGDSSSPDAKEPTKDASTQDAVVVQDSATDTLDRPDVIDAGSACDLAKPFDGPVPLDGVNTTSADHSARLSSNQLILYFSSDRAGTAGGYDLWTASRGSVSGSFGSATQLANVNSAAHDFLPALPDDGLLLYFTSERTGGIGGRDTWVSKRNVVTSDFPSPSTLSNVNSASDDTDAFVTADGKALYFASNRPNGLGSYDVYASMLGGNGVFGAPAPVVGVNSSSSDQAPVLSGDGRTMYFMSFRPGGLGGGDVWMARRQSVQDGFNAPTPVTELNSVNDDFVTWLSADGCTVLLSSNRGTSYDIMTATKPK